MTTRSEATAGGDEVLSSLRRLVSESDEFLQATVGETNPQAKEVRARLQATLAQCRTAFGKLEQLGTAGARSADRAIRTHPYESIGVALGVGLLIGVLVGRR